MAVLAIVVWLLFTALQHQVNLDEDLCPQDFEPTAYWSVLLDVTDPFSPVAKLDLRQQIMDRIHSVIPQFGKLSLFTVAPFGDELPGALLARCNPGAGDEASPLYQNPLMIQRRWETEFDSPLRELLDSVVEGAGEPQSPIMEMIQLIAIQYFPSRTDKQKRLFIFSDLLQHSENYSQYREPVDFEHFRSLPSFSRLRTDLRDLEVVVFYIGRDNPVERRIQGRSHIAFWEKYFDEFGAKLVEVRRIQG